VSYALARRLALPLWLAFAAAALAVMPGLALLARGLSAVTRRPEPVALIRLLYVYVTGELAMLLAPARSHEERLRQLTRFLDDLVRAATGELRLRVTVEAEASAEAVLRARERPVLVLCRHAGAGDSVLLVHLLLARYGRAPGIVMKEILTLDPVVGIVSRHLPAALIDGAPDDPDEIRAVARGLGPDAALLLFPEGGNITPDRRSKAIEWLHRNEHPRRASRFDRLRHVMAPRPRGVLAALDGASGADVVLVAHAGLGYRELPRDKTIAFRLWHVPAAELPPDTEDARIEWLDEWWERIDAWVAANGG
jgi:1-acyl-sn-glycerol-3-phosphate acyltransferase